MPDPADGITSDPASVTAPVAIPSPPEDASPAVPELRLHPRPPRPGDLTLGWRAIVAGTWIGVVIGFAAVWNVSAQLGLSTWWLGPRADPQPRFIQFSPFVTPVLVLLATINQVRRLGWWCLAASVAVAAFGVGDLGRVTSLAIVELAIAGAALAVSVASFTGMYRAPRADGRAATSDA